MHKVAETPATLYIWSYFFSVIFVCLYNLFRNRLTTGLCMDIMKNVINTKAKENKSYERN